MGQSLNTDGGVTHFNDLGVYRYMYKIARIDELRDMYQDQVAHIATYARDAGDIPGVRRQPHQNLKPPVCASQYPDTASRAAAIALPNRSPGTQQLPHTASRH